MALDGGVGVGKVETADGMGRDMAGGGGGEPKRRVATFEPAPPNLARHGPCPGDGNIKHQCCMLEMPLWCSWLEQCLVHLSGLGFNSCMLHFFFPLYIYK